MFAWAYSLFKTAEVVSPVEESNIVSISLQDAQRILKHDTHCAIFHVRFRTRTTGEIREMQCKRHITSHLAGGVRHYTDEEKKLVTVFDTFVQDYRSIPLEGIQQIRISGKIYNVV